MRILIATLMLIGPSAMAGEPDNGASTIYRVYCSGCHNDDGNGLGPSFTNEKARLEKPDAELQNSILNGLGISMPAFGWMIGPEQAQHVVEYLKERYTK
jgi:mono/diheme cytochrome c family protein